MMTKERKAYCKVIVNIYQEPTMLNTFYKLFGILFFLNPPQIIRTYFALMIICNFKWLNSIYLFIELHLTYSLCYGKKISTGLARRINQKR